jgi:microcystin degradation protein MlrC
MQLNSHAQLGPMALLRIVDERVDLRVIVGSSRCQCLDLAILRHLGVEPTEQGILAVKSTVHFRADFDPIAAETLVAIAPGANYCRLTEIDYHNLRAGVRLEPLGPEHGA